ncbi:MAG: hypothetical protein MUC42_00025 [Bryobacter sp.]|nr:hypothetical protein [Bryobacter sp.]
MRFMITGKTVILACIVPAFAVCQDLAYLHQFATIPNDMVADETGVYLTVDDTRAVFPGSNVLNKAITFRKFSLLTGAEEWSRELWTNANLGAGLGAYVAMDFSGIYVSLNVPLSANTRKATLRKYHRNGSLLWTSEITTSTQESIMAITAANGLVYAITNSPGVGNILYRIDPNTGAALSVTPAGTSQQVNRLKAGPGGIYSFGSVNPALLRKFDLAGNLVWERAVTPGFTVGLALVVHPTGIYAGGQRGVEGFLVRFDENGNVVSNTTIAPNPAGNLSIRDLVAAPDGIFVMGTAAGGFPGQTQFGTLDTFVRKQTFGGDVRQTFVFGSPGFTLSPSASALAGNAFFVYGLTSGTYPGNVPFDFQRAALARINLPEADQRSLASILAEIPSPAGNSLRNRANAICNQLSGLLRDLQNQRGPLISPDQTDLAIAKIGEVQTLMGCTQ